MNDSEHNTRDTTQDEASLAWNLGDAEAGSAAPRPSLADLSPAAADRIRRYLAESTFRGGASPSDVADLYTSQEVMDDDDATAYLDRRFVHGEVADDWRDLQDQLSTAHYDGPPASSPDALLARVRNNEYRASSQRSIFDDPEDDELFDEDSLDLRLEDRDPHLSDLSQGSRSAIERYIVSEVMCYGIAPYRVMQLREDLRVAGDERALQYLALPFELGDRPADWDGLRDRALMARARLESLGIDPADAYHEADGTHPDMAAGELLAWLEDHAGRR